MTTRWGFVASSQFGSIVCVEELGTLYDNAVSDRFSSVETVQAPALMTMFGVLAKAPRVSKEATAKAVNFILNECGEKERVGPERKCGEKRRRTRGSHGTTALLTPARGTCQKRDVTIWQHETWSVSEMLASSVQRLCLSLSPHRPWKQPEATARASSL